MKIKIILFALFCLLTTANIYAQKAAKNSPVFADDIHSYAKPNQVRVVHVDLDWTVSFEEKSIKGSATLNIERNDRNAPLMLDTRDLTIERIETTADGRNFRRARFEIGTPEKFLGSSLTVQLPRNAKQVRIFYSTSPTASGLQWLSPEQTAGKKQPFMFSQAQAIHARSFIPLQDSPQVRVTYSARVRTPKNLLAVMSAAGNLQTLGRTGDYRFLMTKPIPPYLIAIAVGDLKFKSLGLRSGVYTEPSMLEKSAYELADTEKMITAAEKLYGAYRWGRYDLLVLPPSFPFGGMENPMLTFATPTILAGDRSLVSLVAHELAHSWSGNLVTNATWRDFWLNEGTTTYIENRIIEELYGRPRSEMEAYLGRRGLEESLAEFADADEILHIDLSGRDPDDGMTDVAYQKGSLFLRHLEQTAGREKFDKFLRGWFDTHAFQSVTTATFVEHLEKNLLKQSPQISRDDVQEWIYKAGLPANAPQPKSDAFNKVGAEAQQYTNGKSSLSAINTKTWTTQEWLHFLKSMPENLSTEKMAELDRTFNFTKIGNSEIAFQWLYMSIKNNYKPADARLEEFLTTIGRRKFVRPLFTELVKTPDGMRRACEIYAKARRGYHPITQTSVDALVKCN